MAKKIVGSVDEIKKLLDAGKLVLGADETLKMLRQGKLVKVFMSANCAPETKADVEQYCKIAKVEIVELQQSNEELGTLCRKPYFVSVLGVQS